jgi:hypothetical protein
VSRRNGVDAFASAIPIIRPYRVAGAAGPARRLKLGDESRNLRRVEHFCELSDRRGRWYLEDVHGAEPFVVQTPGGANLAGVIYLVML